MLLVWKKLLRIGDEQSTVNTMFGSDVVAFIFHPCKIERKFFKSSFHIYFLKFSSLSDTAEKVRFTYQTKWSASK